MMQQAGSSPSNLEIASVALDALVPIFLAFLGILIYRLTSTIQHKYWLNQKLVEKQLEVYGLMAPLINDVYCYFDWVGNWKELTPLEIIDAKRKLDKTFLVNEFLFSRNFGDYYFDFMNVHFKTFEPAGRDARLRTSIESRDGVRSRDSAKWQPEWKRHFCAVKSPDLFVVQPVRTYWPSGYRALALGLAGWLKRNGVLQSQEKPPEPCPMSERCLVACAYQDLMLSFAKELGITGDVNDPPKGGSRSLRAKTAAERQKRCDKCWRERDPKLKINRLAHWGRTPVRP